MRITSSHCHPSHHRMIGTCHFALLASLGLLVAHPAHAQRNAPSTGSISVATSAPRLFFGGKLYSPPTSALAPYRDPVDGQVCISPDALSGLGVVYVFDDRMAQVTLSVMGGESSVTVPRRTAPDGGVAVPLIATIEGLGGKCQTDNRTGTVYCRAVLTGVEMFAGQLRVRATFPIYPQVSRDSGGRKITVDVPGADVGKLSRTLNLNAPAISQARVTQFQDDTVRLVLEMKEAGNFALLGKEAATVAILNPAPVGVAPARVTGFVPVSKTAARPSSAPRSQVSQISFHAGGDRNAQFVIRTGKAPVARTIMARNRLTVDLLNTGLSPSVAAGLLAAKHPFLKAAQIVTRDGTARLILDLTRAVVFTVKPDRAGSLLLDLNLPKSAGGTLAGKTIVVDAGHGGGDSGATGSGYREKDITLGVSLQLADVLRDAGANVILTRADDNFISVNERPRIANRAGADFFLSVHADSGDSNHSVSGSTVYFHGSDPNCRTLARCIADRFEQMGGIRSRGTGTDYARFPGAGYGVLRGSRMVAVLVECGFISNSGDARMLTQASIQRRVAENIAAGLRDYIEGNPNVNFGSNNPNIGAGEGFPPVEGPEVAPFPESEGEGMPSPDVPAPDVP